MGDRNRQRWSPRATTLAADVYRLCSLERSSRPVFAGPSVMRCLTIVGFRVGKVKERSLHSAASPPRPTVPPRRLVVDTPLVPELTSTSTSFLSGVDVAVLDCDGVLWTGAEPVPGAAEGKGG